MRPWWILLPAVVLGGCAPTALTVAALAASGATYITTGKSVSDLTLSAMAQRDCEMLRLVRGEPMCHPRTPGDAAATATALADLGSDPGYDAGPWQAAEVPISELAPAGESADGSGLHPGRRAEEAAVRDGLYLVRNGDARVVADVSTLRSGTALFEGFSAPTEVFALIQDDGALEVFVHDPTRAEARFNLKMVFMIGGYARNPDAFTGLWLNGAFHFVGNIVV